MRPDEEARAREARTALDRAGRESESIFGSTARRAARHFGGADADPADRVEVWGRRVGRVLSLIGVVVLALLLFHQLAER